MIFNNSFADCILHWQIRDTVGNFALGNCLCVAMEIEATVASAISVY